MHINDKVFQGKIMILAVMNAILATAQRSLKFQDFLRLL